MKDKHKLDYAVAQQRFNEMSRLMNALQQEKCKLEAIYQHKYQLFQEDTGAESCFFLLEKRLKTKGVRSYVLHKMGEYIAWEQNRKLNSIEQQQIQQLGFIAETIITIQYLHNQILDGKAKITDNVAINKNLIASNLLRELLFDYINEVFDLNIAKKIERHVGNIFLYVDVGQSVEMNYGHYDALPKNRFNDISDTHLSQWIDQQLECIRPSMEKLLLDCPIEYASFVKLYFRRVFLTNAALYVVMSQIIEKILKFESAGNFLKFFVKYSILFQIVNDVADTVKVTGKDTVGKDEDDVFCDLKNQNITLPLLLHLVKSPYRLVRRYLSNPSQNQYIIKDFQIELLLELRESGAIDACVQFGSELADLATALLNPDNPISPFLKDMTTIAYWNIYYKKFYKKNDQ